MYDALVYPGWILQDMRIMFLDPLSALLLVMVMMGIASPTKLYVKTSTLTFYLSWI